MNWHKYPSIKPSEAAKYTDFLVAYPNPRIFTSKFANMHFNDGRPLFIYDVAQWTGKEFAITDSKVRYWAPITSPEASHD